MSLAELIHRVATGSRRRRAWLTPVGLVVFGGSLLLVVVVGVGIDRVLRLPPLLPGPLGLGVGTALLAVGLVLCAWCVVRFRQAAGTPVPMNPPTDLVVEGPYRWTRNPMLTGVFTGLFGLGIQLHSFGMVFVSIPAYVLLHVLELRLVEEPELERRFGASYAAYRSQVPMFWPRMSRRLHPIAISGSLYLVIGVASAVISNPLEPGTAQAAWRLGALGAGVIVLVLHIRTETTRCRTSPRIAAAKAAGAVALGTLLLAVYANVSAFVGTTSIPNSLLLALVIWPLVTGALSFPIALALATLYARRSRTT